MSGMLQNAKSWFFGKISKLWLSLTWSITTISTLGGGSVGGLLGALGGLVWVFACSVLILVCIAVIVDLVVAIAIALLVTIMAIIVGVVGGLYFIPLWLFDLVGSAFGHEPAFIEYAAVATIWTGATLWLLVITPKVLAGVKRRQRLQGEAQPPSEEEEGEDSAQHAGPSGEEAS